MPAHTMQQEIKIPAIRQHRGGERQRPKKKLKEKTNRFQINIPSGEHILGFGIVEKCKHRKERKNGSSSEQ